MLETETDKTDFAPNTKSSFETLIEANEKRHFDVNGDLVLRPGALAAKPTAEELKEIGELYLCLLCQSPPNLPTFDGFTVLWLLARRAVQGRVSRL